MKLFIVVNKDGKPQRKYKGNPFYVRRHDAETKARRLNNTSWRFDVSGPFIVKEYKLTEV